MEFFSVMVTEGCPTTSLKVVGLYFLADTMNFSISDLKDSKVSHKVESHEAARKRGSEKTSRFLAVFQKVSTFAVNFLITKY
jgi:hypothetical protein